MVPGSDGQPGGLSDEQRAGLEVRQADQDRTLEAVHQLEGALSAAAPGREEDWRRTVLSALAVLDDATAEETDNAERADSLLSDIARNQPRLRNRVRGVRIQYRHLRETIAALRRELDDHPDAGLDYGGPAPAPRLDALGPASPAGARIRPDLRSLLRGVPHRPGGRRRSSTGRAGRAGIGAGRMSFSRRERPRPHHSGGGYDAHAVRSVPRVGPPTGGSWSPIWRAPSMPMDASRQGDRFAARFDLPGIRPESLELTVEKNVLTVSAERSWQPEEGTEVVVAERPQGSFSRQLFLGEGLDAEHVEAHYDNGVLTVTIPVAEAARPRKVAINSSGDAKAISAPTAA